MAKKITVRNLNHPRNIMLAIGQAAKKEVRKMSNADLDEYVELKAAVISGLVAE